MATMNDHEEPAPSCCCRCCTCCTRCRCCPYGKLGPILGGIMAGVAGAVSYVSWYCIGDIVAAVLCLPILILTLLPACLRYRSIGAVRASYGSAAALCVVCIAMKAWCGTALSYGSPTYNDDFYREMDYPSYRAFGIIDFVAMILWVAAAIALFVAAAKAEERKLKEPVEVPATPVQVIAESKV